MSAKAFPQDFEVKLMDKCSIQYDKSLWVFMLLNSFYAGLNWNKQTHSAIYVNFTYPDQQSYNLTGNQ